MTSSVTHFEIMVVGGTRWTVRYLFQLGNQGADQSYKHQLGKAALP